MHRKVIWYDFLNNPSRRSLCKDYNLQEGLVVRWETTAGNKYAWFMNHIHFQSGTKNLSQNFHEVVTGKRKAYFDIDKAESIEELYETAERVCKAVMKIVPECEKKDFFLFSSNSKDKFSAHVILHNFYFSSHLQVKELFNLVCKEMPDKAELLDSGVYSSTQNLRMLNSSKLGQNRPKIHDENLVIDGEKVVYVPPEPDLYSMEILRISLVGCIYGCKLLPDLYKEGQKEEQDLEGSDINKAVKLCRERIKDFPFKKKEVVKNNILLQRIRPSQCPSCRRVHEHENPYIKVNVLDVFFHCRRGRYYFVGQLGEDEEIHKQLIQEV